MIHEEFEHIYMSEVNRYSCKLTLVDIMEKIKCCMPTNDCKAKDDEILTIREVDWFKT
jgi:hypothetical protein